jgi:hypothetical protein
MSIPGGVIPPSPYIRLLPLAVVLFWLFGVGWLCAVIWAPPESRMARIDPREVYEVFFAWNESTNMTLLDNGARRGQVTIAGGSGDDPDTGVYSNSLSISGMLGSANMPAYTGGVEIFWRGVLEFSDDMKLREGDFSFRIPRRQTSIHFTLEEKSGERDGGEKGDLGESIPLVMEARVVVNKQEIMRYKSDAGKGAAAALPMELPMMPLLGMDSLDMADFQFEPEARMGKFSFGGRDLRTYLLTIRPQGREESLRVYLSEAGEPLRIETDFGFEAVSEILVPLDAYRVKEAGGKDD